MENRHSGTSILRAGNHSQFKDLTNKSRTGNENHVGENLRDIQLQRGQGWYAQMSDDKKAVYL